MNHSDALLLLFVKHPVAGKAKTRLAKSIGNEKALVVYRKLLTYTCEIAKQLHVNKVVFYGNQIPESDLWSEAGFARYEQHGETLGDRMENAFLWGFEQGYKQIIIIGSDCADIDSTLLEDAFSQLDNHDFVMGPANDGGYYLMGMNALFSPVFQNKNWSTESVLQDTLRDLEAGNKSYFLLPVKTDIDTVEDLKGTFLEEYMQFAS